VHDGVEYEVDCIILASGFEITSELSKRWGIDTIEGRNGVSIYDHWADGYKTLHGMMTRGFPNQFFTGFTQAGLNSTNSVTFVSQGRHIGYIVSEALKRGATVVEPSQQAQDAWVKTIRETAIDTSQFARECTPGYFNNEGEDKLRWYLGEPYGPGFYAFEQLLEEWRGRGDLRGLELGT
jgi:cyclohexanone monooxygenase